MKLNSVHKKGFGATRPFGRMHLVHIRSECSRSRAQSYAYGIVIEVRIAAAGLVVASEITRRIGGKIDLLLTKYY